ncbi:MAG: hypothetical protein H6739_05375 [Alphaproteobacteria bacterium]|nr:hypothetical protein [Alphaproteobacteria bacterium]
MDTELLYDLVVDAVKQGLYEEAGGGTPRLTKRMVSGTVTFTDAEGRTVKEIPAESLFKKVTAVREKLRVLEQKVNNHSALDDADRAELQTYITRAYGSLTTFNFLFRDDEDRFKGTGG